MGDAHDSVARRLQGSVPGSVALEGGPVPVVCEAVEFDYEPVARPEGVRLAVEHGCVEGRLRQSLLVAECGKAVLERGAGRHRLAGSGHEASQTCEATSIASLRADLLQPAHLQPAQPVRLLECPGEALLINDFRQVEEGAGQGSDGNPSSCRPFRRPDLALVKHDSLAPPPTMLGGHVHRRRTWAHQTPEGRRAAVAEHGSLSAGENSGHPVAVL